ncbi:MAG: hypothetical protein ACR2PG_00985 [Hyphomicrobiaceae bacterium]
MTKSKDYVEKLHAQLTNVASREQLLIRALSEALSSADRKLLDDVRSLTVEHETRRAMILSELQTLAQRIGTFPASNDALDQIEYEPLDLPYDPEEEELEEPEQLEAVEEVAEVPETVEAAEAAEAVEAVEAGGDWRQALENIRTGAGLPAVNGSRRMS